MWEAAKRSIPSQMEREKKLWQVLEDRDVWSALENDLPRARELAMQKLVG